MYGQMKFHHILVIGLWFLLRVHYLRAETVIHPSKSSKASLKIIAVAGVHGEVLSDVEVFDPFSSNSSCKKPTDYPLRTDYLTASGDLFCGGYSDSNDFYTHKCHKFMDNNWTEISSLIEPRYAASSIVLNTGEYWIMGGFDGSNTLNSSELLDSNDGSFVMNTELPEKMEQHCVSKINDTHIFIGGSYYHPRMAYVVNVATEEFEFVKLPALNTNRWGSACAKLVDVTDETKLSLLIAGGDEEGGYKTSEIFPLYMPNGNWTEGPALPRGFQYGGYVSTIEHPLIMVGGIDENRSDMKNVMEFQIDTNTFEILPGKLTIPRNGLAITTMETTEDC